MAFSGVVDSCLKERQWDELRWIITEKATLRSLFWSPRTSGLQKAVYLKLPWYLVQAVARLRFGANNLAVHRGAWKSVAWEDRCCWADGEVQSESHVLGSCGVFSPERMRLLEELEEFYDDSKSWDIDRLMCLLVNPKSVCNAKVAGHFLRTVWREVDEKYLE